MLQSTSTYPYTRIHFQNIFAPLHTAIPVCYRNTHSYIVYCVLWMWGVLVMCSGIKFNVGRWFRISLIACHTWSILACFIGTFNGQKSLLRSSITMTWQKIDRLRDLLHHIKFSFIFPFWISCYASLFLYRLFHFCRQNSGQNGCHYLPISNLFVLQCLLSLLF